MIESIASFKPKESYLDLRTSGKLQSSTRNDNFHANLEKIKKQVVKKEKKQEQELAIKSEPLISQEEAKRTNYIMNFKPETVKKKRSQMQDFKDERFFIQNEPKGQGSNEFS